MNGPWKGKKKMLLLLRRSMGEKGTTREQLARIKPTIDKMVKDGYLHPINWDVVGKDIDNKRKFQASRDLIKIGDVYNEGEGTSGFNVQDRKVLQEALKRMRAGEYDGIMAETMDRIARDYGALASIAYPDWKENGKVFWSLTENEGLGTEDPIEEATINTKMTWGGITKRIEAKKSAAALKGKLAQGYVAGGRPEWIGSKSKGAGLDYRKAWRLMQLSGENAKGNLSEPKMVANRMGKRTFDNTNKVYIADHGWAKRWYRKMKAFDELGVLDEWLDNVEAVNRWITNQGRYPAATYKSTPAKNLLSSSAGYFAFPAGLNPAKQPTIFIQFPAPLDIGLQELADNKDPTVLENWEVIQDPIKDMELNVYQTQPRSGERAKRK